MSNIITLKMVWKTLEVQYYFWSNGIAVAVENTLLF